MNLINENMMQIDENIDFKQIPLTALRQKGRLLLSKLLNPIKILPSEEGYPRDWRGIAHLIGIQNLHSITIINNQTDAMAKTLQLWITDNKKTATFANLRIFLGVIDRWDVSDDISEILCEDAKSYLETKYQQTLASQNQGHIIQINEKQSIDENIITKDDVIRAQEGLSPQFYDAFVLFADEDVDFATELIEKMENYGFKLCVRERDIIGGISFEHEAILRLISERCNRLIVIVSPAFLKSRANTFFVNFAQALGIEQGRRKIVPCLYERCVLPPTLSYYFLLNYQRSSKLWNFWEKLKDSIQSTPIELDSKKHIIQHHEINNRPQVPKIQITEVVSNQQNAIILQEKSICTTDNNIKEKSSKRSDISSSIYDSIERINLKTNYKKNTKNQFCQLPPSSERTQSLMNLSNIQNDIHNNLSIKMNCGDITRSINDVSQLNTTMPSNHKGKKWYKKFLSVSSIFDSSTTKKTKKNLSKSKLATVTS